MKCKEIQERLLKQVDRGLSPRESRKITAHLIECSECEVQYRLLRETHRSLEVLGEAVRSGDVNMVTPHLPPRPGTHLWDSICGWLSLQVPLWIPSAVSVALVLIVAASTFSPLDLTIGWGKEKGGGNKTVSTPPLAAEAMLEFLLVPDPADAGQLAASTATLEAFLRAHPDDLAMHAKLIELYRAQIGHPDIPELARESLAIKLGMEQERIAEMLETTPLFNGERNDAN